MSSTTVEQPQTKAHWSAGIKSTVSFANLESVKKYKPSTYLLFKEPFHDSDRTSDGKYDHRLRHSQRFGWSFTKFEKANTTSYSSVTTIKQQSQPQQQPQVSKLLQIRQQSQQIQTLLDILSAIQKIGRDSDAVIISFAELVTI